MNKDVSKFRLNGQVDLITGSTVFVNGRDKKVLAARCKNLIDLGYYAKAAFFDATNIEAINRFSDYTETPIDILENNAVISFETH